MEVSTSNGRIRGIKEDGLNIFRGIPIAAISRFESPQKCPKWEGVLDCHTTYSYPQNTETTKLAFRYVPKVNNFEDLKFGLGF